ncbi:rhodanese-like domain-containing protein [Anaeromyxobacter paludicola]|uniref:Rhodanese domain-containing protein n=1 Tax=Anaeromyxobacter paludicola TaxID=2918171 RepID=A0ABN6N109_9BACT|nr:hypothetical protein [Anaeromyxobacter paludicola]BDG06894.1 hypothetical protein AMPC_00070 [Anaeromyxobacter paludicola]
MELPRITVEQVRAREQRGERFTFLDARNPTAWGQASDQVHGALRVPADEVDRHTAEIPRERAVVAYCT